MTRAAAGRRPGVGAAGERRPPAASGAPAIPASSAAAVNSAGHRSCRACRRRRRGERPRPSSAAQSAAARDLRVVGGDDPGEARPHRRAGSGRASPDSPAPGRVRSTAPGARRDLDEAGVVGDRRGGPGRLGVELADVRRGGRVLGRAAGVGADRDRVPRPPLGVVEELGLGPRGRPALPSACSSASRAPSAASLPVGAPAARSAAG